MYFWRTDRLAADFASKRVDRRQKLFYFLGVYLLFSADFLDVVVGKGQGLTAWTTVSVAALEMGAISLCYRENRLVDGEEFVDRLMAFSFANLLRIVAVVAAFYGIIIFGTWFFIKFYGASLPLTLGKDWNVLFMLPGIASWLFLSGATYKRLVLLS